MHSSPTGTVFTGPDQSYVIMLPHTIGLRLFHEDLAISSKAFAFVAPAVLPDTLSDGFSILLQPSSVEHSLFDLYATASTTYALSITGSVFSCSKSKQQEGSIDLQAHQLL